MGYTSEDQKLQNISKDLVSNIEKFSENTDNRLKAKESWQESHLRELHEFRQKLLDIKTELLLMGLIQP